jgi:AcrR family transcriptional regulator
VALISVASTTASAISGTEPEAQAAADSVSERIIAVAREIIDETGDFDLPMRALAARAKVSLRTPYTLFGSKNGVIAAILQADVAAWHVKLRPLQTRDPLVDLFDNLQRGIAFYRTHQPFYRAMFRATENYAGSMASEASRMNLRPMKIICHRLRERGELLAGVDPDVLAESLTDIIASTHRQWAMSTFDVGLVHWRCAFGYATLLAGSTIEPVAKTLRERALKFQREIVDFREP